MSGVYDDKKENDAHEIAFSLQQKKNKKKDPKLNDVLFSFSETTLAPSLNLFFILRFEL